ncbi:MAG: alpha/beta hydrolase [Pseudomonadales bacterium]|nr:alpha/beta hydrolase [Pseudomonadales bacterium]
MAQTNEQSDFSGNRSDDSGSRTSKLAGPGMLDSLTELPRTLFEVSMLTTQWASLMREAPEAQPHPVMILPGFSAGDSSTVMLRRFLTQLGYKPLPWLQGVNTGHPRLLEAAMIRFYRLSHSMGTKISLVGQSLGGVYAREIAKQFPDAVRSVITLGSPYGATETGSTNPLVEKLFERMSGLTVEELRAMMPSARESAPLAMPTTSVYSKADGVVGWETCIEPESPTSENIRVWGSHSGMGMNPDVFRIVADRLAQDPESWQPFKADRTCLKLIYPPTDKRA